MMKTLLVKSECTDAVRLIEAISDMIKISSFPYIKPRLN